MNCPVCGAENQAEQRFCNECAAPFKKRCAKCGYENAPTAKFCGECAAALTSNVLKSTARTSSTPSVRVVPEHTKGELQRSQIDVQVEAGYRFRCNPICCERPS